MNFKSVSIRVFALIFSFFLLASCGEGKSEKKEGVQKEATEEISAKHEFQCPMDCEKGKTYAEAGSCPVCKMDLKEAKGAHGDSCKMHEGGECSCKADQCKCKDCKKHGKKGESCEKDENGQCTCKECKCKNCAEHAEAMSCKKDKDGNCNCKKGECKCENCQEHA